MMKNEFHVVLPSDSSMAYYPYNTVARYTTQLPEEIKLQGKWVVGLTEFTFPHTFSNVKGRAGLHLYAYKRITYLHTYVNVITKMYGVFFKLNNNGYVSFNFESDEYDEWCICTPNETYK